tara:strand:- start:166 stop:324 length:159 start_codon:yes stop_codon:yes gene_type:complete
VEYELELTYKCEPCKNTGVAYHGFKQVCCWHCDGKGGKELEKLKLETKKDLK